MCGPSHLSPFSRKMSILAFLHKPQTSLSHSLIKNGNCPDVHQLIMKCSTTKRVNIQLLHAIIWMNLKDLMLSERSRTAKEDVCMSPFLNKVQKQANHICGDRSQNSSYPGE